MIHRAAAAEAAATAAVGGVLGGAALAAFGLAVPGAVIGAANGALSGWRGVYDWRRPTGPLAFVLDTTWAAPMTAAALVTHGVAAAQPRRGGYLVELSRRANRHVYARGFRMRRRFVVTIGNAVHNAGEHASTSPGRRRVVTDHEDVHVWQSRWFGPFFPLLYGGWLVLGAAAGAVVWVVRGRRDGFGRTVETCAYYLNPFEWWAYSRAEAWPPPAKVDGLGWRAPIVGPLSETTRRSRRPVTPAPPAALG